VRLYTCWTLAVLNNWLLCWITRSIYVRSLSFQKIFEAEIITITSNRYVDFFLFLKLSFDRICIPPPKKDWGIVRCRITPYFIQSYKCSSSYFRKCLTIFTWIYRQLIFVLLHFNTHNLISMPTIKRDSYIDYK
jgi:hypothetical protein